MIVKNRGDGVRVTSPSGRWFDLAYTAVRLDWDDAGRDLLLRIRRWGRWDLIEVMPAGTTLRAL